MNKVTYRPEGDSGRQTLVVSLDRKWLEDPERVFPVKADPSVKGVSAGTYVEAPYSTTFSSDKVLKVGTYDGGAHKAARSWVYLFTLTRNGEIAPVRSAFGGQYSGVVDGEVEPAVVRTSQADGEASDPAVLRENEREGDLEHAVSLRTPADFSGLAGVGGVGRKRGVRRLQVPWELSREAALPAVRYAHREATAEAEELPLHRLEFVRTAPSADQEYGVDRTDQPQEGGSALGLVQRSGTPGLSASHRTGSSHVGGEAVVAQFRGGVPGRQIVSAWLPVSMSRWTGER
ncbi:hypothetical protein OHA84_36435 [Streptomyces sp. NBC_00513]|uniref:hypothetical protein n=1 Tax=unclassified Streptomyces TaxID=2593676 RepID=UPI00224D6507|nr:hypothetical protein [Streptomyces sp. NBC_00424]MCX5071009.1 hypothetical protein [Streptomyces sp. NBC_00424]WUD45556.1 hypothetical protein OHA84_36435 [Streptomyces sp. NBC_00513]